MPFHFAVVHAWAMKKKIGLYRKQRKEDHDLFYLEKFYVLCSGWSPIGLTVEGFVAIKLQPERTGGKHMQKDEEAREEDERDACRDMEKANRLEID